MPEASKAKTMCLAKNNMQAPFTKPSHVLEGKERQKELKVLN